MVRLAFAVDPLNHQAVVVDHRAAGINGGSEVETAVKLHRGQRIFERYRGLRCIFTIGEGSGRVVVLNSAVGLVVDRQSFAERNQAVPRVDNVLSGRYVHRRCFGTADVLERTVVVKPHVGTGILRQVFIGLSDSSITGRNSGAVERHRTEGKGIFRRDIVAADEERFAGLVHVAIASRLGSGSGIEGGFVFHQSFSRRAEKDRVGNSVESTGIAAEIGAGRRGIPGNGRPGHRELGTGIRNVDTAAFACRRIVGDQRLINRGHARRHRDTAAVTRGRISGNPTVVHRYITSGVNTAAGAAGRFIVRNSAVIYRVLAVFKVKRASAGSRGIVVKQAVLDRRGCGAGTMIAPNRTALGAFIAGKLASGNKQ